MKKQYKLKKGNLDATMIVLPEGYLVLKNSQISLTQTHCLSNGWKKIRKNLIDEGLVENYGSIGVLKKDMLFSSPSAAASTLVGSQCAGPISWKDSDGSTFKENQKLNS